MELRCQGVGFRYGPKAALAGIDMACTEGVTVVVGENGAGKTTLLKILATLARPLEGSVSLGGEDYRALNRNELRRRIGYLDQFADFPGRFTVREAIRYGLWLHKVPRDQWNELVDDAVRLTDVVELLDQRVASLSGGTRRRALTAQAMAHKPDVVLLDEPATGLDPHQQELLNAVLPRLAERRILVLSTHSLEQVATLAGQLIVLTRGGIAHRSIHEPGSLTVEQVRAIMTETAWSS